MTEPKIYCFTCRQLAVCQKCSTCRRVFYCSRDCQRADWGRHKAECAANSKVDPDAMHARVKSLTSCASFMEICGAIAAANIGANVNSGFIKAVAAPSPAPNKTVYTITHVPEQPANGQTDKYVLIIQAGGLAGTVLMPVGLYEPRAFALPLQVLYSDGVVEII